MKFYVLTCNDDTKPKIFLKKENAQNAMKDLYEERAEWTKKANAFYDGWIEDDSAIVLYYDKYECSRTEIKIHCCKIEDDND